MSDDLRVLLDELTEAGDERLPGPWHAVESGDRAAYGWWLENPRGDSSFPTPQDVAVMFNALPALLARLDKFEAVALTARHVAEFDWPSYWENANDAQDQMVAALAALDAAVRRG